jgi:hypothetical protein
MIDERLNREILISLHNNTIRKMIHVKSLSFLMLINEIDKRRGLSQVVIYKDLILWKNKYDRFDQFREIRLEDEPYDLIMVSSDSFACSTNRYVFGYDLTKNIETFSQDFNFRIKQLFKYNDN